MLARSVREQFGVQQAACAYPEFRPSTTSRRGSGICFPQAIDIFDGITADCIFLPHAKAKFFKRDCDQWQIEVAVNHRFGHTISTYKRMVGKSQAVRSTGAPYRWVFGKSQRPQPLCRPYPSTFLFFPRMPPVQHPACLRFQYTSA